MITADEIKRSVDGPDLIGKYVSLKRCGGNWVGNCPFHDDKRPRQRIVIMGGTPMAVWLSRALRNRSFAIRIFETDRERAEELKFPGGLSLRARRGRSRTGLRPSWRRVGPNRLVDRPLPESRSRRPLAGCTAES